MEFKENILDVSTADLLCDWGASLSVRHQGKKEPSDKQFYASLFFTRICLNFIGLLRTTPGSKYYEQVKGIAVRDVGSQATLGRALIEGYFAFHYHCIMVDTEDESEFKRILWRYHEESQRLKMLEAGVPGSKHLNEVEERKKESKDSLELNGFFQSLSEGLRKDLLRGEKFKHLQNVDLCHDCDISIGYYKSTYRYLSAFAHYNPFSIQQFDSSRNGVEDTLAASKHICSIVSAFFAKALDSFRCQFPDDYFQMSDEIEDVVRLWSDILEAHGEVGK